jgi:WD40 repeat protein
VADRSGTTGALPTKPDHASLLDADRGSPDSRLLLSTCGPAPNCRYDQRVFDVASGQEVTVYSKHDNTVLAATFSPDGLLVATAGGSNQEIRIWDPHTGETKAVLKGTGGTLWAGGFRLLLLQQ